jgi:putative ABC transport system substrate-binding protein
MRRREFMSLLAGAAAAWPLAAQAQQPERVWRIAMLHPGSWDFPADAALFAAFLRQMNDLGYAEGKNLIIDKRAAQGRLERLPALAMELVALHPDIIVAVATPAIAAAKRATTTIPIVMTPATDPIGSGFVKSLAQPGGNITGLANMFGELTAKSDFFFPTAKNVAISMSTNPTHPAMIDIVRGAAQSLGISVRPVLAAAPADLEAAFQEIERLKADALLVLADPIRPVIVSLAEAKRIPAIYQFSEFAEVAG